MYACLWNWVAQVVREINFDSKNPDKVIITWITNYELETLDPSGLYLTSFYYAIVTIATGLLLIFQNMDI